MLEQLLRGAVRGVRLDGPHRGMRAHERDLRVARDLTRDADGELGQVGLAPGGQDRHARAIGDRRGGGRDARDVGPGEHDGGNLAGARDAQRDVEAIGARVRRGAPGEQHDGLLVHAFDVVQVLDERDERDGRLRPRADDIAERGPQGGRLDQLDQRRHRPMLVAHPRSAKGPVGAPRRAESRLTGSRLRAPRRRRRRRPRARPHHGPDGRRAARPGGRGRPRGSGRRRADHALRPGRLPGDRQREGLGRRRGSDPAQRGRAAAHGARRRAHVLLAGGRQRAAARHVGGPHRPAARRRRRHGAGVSRAAAAGHAPGRRPGEPGRRHGRARQRAGALLRRRRLGRADGAQRSGLLRRRVRRCAVLHDGPRGATTPRSRDRSRGRSGSAKRCRPTP